MTTLITVREYARLTTERVEEPSLDQAQVPVSAFDWLCRLNSGFSRAGASLIQIEGRRWLRLDSYVGVLETPCGTRLEILPKHMEDDHDPTVSRALLKRMISAALDLPARNAGPAALQRFQAPLSEWIMGKFLGALDHLIKRGVRSDYLRVESAERYLRGQLNTVRQLRQPPGRQQIFQIRHDIFVPDGPENRLLKAALESVCRATQEPAQWRLAQELRSLLHDMPASWDVDADFKCWRSDRLMAHYQPLRPLCELILYQQMPLALAGEWHGISMLFPMEKLFERYVESAIRQELADDAELTPQAASHSLCHHMGGAIFQLRPDLLVQQGNKCWILDAKWKLLDSADRDGKYGLSQSDFYQLFAYGQKYLGGQGEMVLIYPQHKRFAEVLPTFDFGGGLQLRVIPFDLAKGCLVHNGCTGLPFRVAEEHVPEPRAALA